MGSIPVGVTNENLKRTQKGVSFRFFAISKYEKEDIMNKDVNSVMKSFVIEYVKSHNEHSGKILEAFNHVDEALKILQSLPFDVQNEIQQGIKKALFAQGLIRHI